MENYKISREQAHLFAVAIYRALKEKFETNDNTIVSNVNSCDEIGGENQETA